MAELQLKEYYEKKALCDDKCNPDYEKSKDNKYLPCVTCPFCKEIVTAELTPKTIHCPACKITVER